MKLLLDTNILLRLCDPAHPHHRIALHALGIVESQGFVPVVASQSFGEFFAVATRGRAERGLGMPHATADRELTSLTYRLSILYDSADALALLRKLVVDHQVTGKSVHDARLAAVMLTAGVGHILTLNPQDFSRFNELTVIDPRTL
jgi:predicted nucleic acid-binding protein